MHSFQYVHAENDSIHITPSSPPFDFNNDRTLCGLPTIRMYWGDETLSGATASCWSCFKIIKKRILES